MKISFIYLLKKKLVVVILNFIFLLEFSYWYVVLQAPHPLPPSPKKKKKKHRKSFRLSPYERRKTMIGKKSSRTRNLGIIHI